MSIGKLFQSRPEHTQKTAWMRFQFDSVEQSIVSAWTASFSLACNQLTVNSGTVLNSLESCRLWSQVYSRYDARQKRSAVTTLAKLF